ncbi:MAG: Asp-tRNA(Asn)/Glu-tRNA(Gln) amidotransferase subunit GatA [Christensenellales bacterium]
MKNEEILKLSLTDIVEKLKNKELTSSEVTSNCLEQIEATNRLNALISVNKEIAMTYAKESDERLLNGTARKLEGVPIVVKDNICTTDYKTTCASKMLENYLSPYEATVVKRLKEAGAVIIGKSNLDEFAMGGSGENSAFGKTLNPVNEECVPGGSSSGSAASVASYECYGALGSDTGGSIRLPASFCGVVGVKPTYGLVSRYGLVAFASSLDQIGPIARTTKDCALLLDCIKGYDEKDGTSVKQNYGEYISEIKPTIKGLKIGVAKEYFSLPMNAEVKEAINAVIQFYKDNGAEIVEINLKTIDKALAVYYILSSAEAASNLSRYDGIKYGMRATNCKNLLDVYYNSRTEGFGDEVKRRIMIGNYCLSSGYYDAYYKKALQVKEVLKNEFKEAFSMVDAIISPVSSTPAFKFGSKTSPLDMYLTDIYTVPVNIVGVPAISFPVAKDRTGLPIGCQLIANNFNENVLFTLANFYEENNIRGKK